MPESIRTFNMAPPSTTQRLCKCLRAAGSSCSRWQIYLGLLRLRDYLRSRRETITFNGKVLNLVTVAALSFSIVFAYSSPSLVRSYSLDTLNPLWASKFLQFVGIQAPFPFLTGILISITSLIVLSAIGRLMWLLDVIPLVATSFLVVVFVSTWAATHLYFSNALVILLNYFAVAFSWSTIFAVAVVQAGEILKWRYRNVSIRRDPLAFLIGCTTQVLASVEEGAGRNGLFNSVESRRGAIEKLEAAAQAFLCASRDLSNLVPVDLRIDLEVLMSTANGFHDLKNWIALPYAATQANLAHHLQSILEKLLCENWAGLPRVQPRAETVFSSRRWIQKIGSALPGAAFLVLAAFAFSYVSNGNDKGTKSIVGIALVSYLMSLVAPKPGDSKLFKNLVRILRRETVSK
jgi:hypothetical protein